MNLAPAFSTFNPNLNPNPNPNLSSCGGGLGLRLRLGLGTETERGGFTLIELTISAAIASIILVASYLCLSAGVAGQKLIEPRTEALQSARAALAMMSADLRSACSLCPDFDFVGEQRTLGEMEADNVDFATHFYT